MQPKGFFSIDARELFPVLYIWDSICGEKCGITIVNLKLGEVHEASRVTPGQIHYKTQGMPGQPSAFVPSYESEPMSWYDIIVRGSIQDIKKQRPETDLDQICQTSRFRSDMASRIEIELRDYFRELNRLLREDPLVLTQRLRKKRTNSLLADDAEYQIQNPKNLIRHVVQYGSSKGIESPNCLK